MGALGRYKVALPRLGRLERTDIVEEEEFCIKHRSLDSLLHVSSLLLWRAMLALEIES